jgi:hypothetical protein
MATQESQGYPSININTHMSRAPVHVTVTSSIRETSLSFNDAPVDLLSSYFTGREEELARVSTALGVVHDDSPSRCVVYGMHGLGKTQLALQYAKQCFEQQRYAVVFFISATTIEKLHRGFDDLLELVNHPQRFELVEQNARLRAARRWLENSGSIDWLLVLDNVDASTINFIRELLPRKNRRGNILFTTRTDNVAKALAGQRHGLIELELPNVEDAAKLLLEESETDLDSVTPSTVSKAENVVKCLGRLPLAVSHAASFMRQTCKSLDDVLHLFQSKHRVQVRFDHRIICCILDIRAILTDD